MARGDDEHVVHGIALSVPGVDEAQGTDDDRLRVAGCRVEPFVNMAATQRIHAAEVTDLALQGNQRQQRAQLADVKVLLQAGLHRIIDQLVLDQLGILLANIDLARDCCQIARVQPFGYRLRRIESKGCLIRRGVLQGVLAQGFGVDVEGVGQRQAAGFKTVGDRDLKVIEGQPGGRRLVGKYRFTHALLGEGIDRRNPEQVFAGLLVQFAQCVDGSTVLIQVSGRSVDQPAGY
ncbi:hypothetical protein D3C76_934290 [compost metagenome]